ncbi:hypothetical protein D3C87_2206430 [compost metagenome]
MISKKRSKAEELVKKFNEGLAQLKKTGRYEEILKTWYNSPIYLETVPSLLPQTTK